MEGGVIRYRGIEIDRKKQTVSHCGFVREFPYTSGGRRKYNTPTKTFESWCYLILSGGVSREQLFWHIYGNDESGGPLDGPHIFHVRFCVWRPDFDRLKLDLVSSKTAGVMFYELRPSVLLTKAVA